MINIVDLSDRSTWPAARALASTFLNENQSATSHTLWAVGHCHIDTAWLWPYAETRRKVVRSWSTQLRLMEEVRVKKKRVSVKQPTACLSSSLNTNLLAHKRNNINGCRRTIRSCLSASRRPPKVVNLCPLAARGLKWTATCRRARVWCVSFSTGSATLKRNLANDPTYSGCQV